jgi:hypothetical protein
MSCRFATRRLLHFQSTSCNLWLFFRPTHTRYWKKHGKIHVNICKSFFVYPLGANLPFLRAKLQRHLYQSIQHHLHQSQGPPQSTKTPGSRLQSPAPSNQFHQAHSRRSSTLDQAVPVKDGVSISRGNIAIK